MINWAITCLLLAVVSAIFAFGGTAEGVPGLMGRVAAIGFLVLATVLFFQPPRSSRS